MRCHAPKIANGCLARQLDLLTFVTHSRFKIVAPRRLIEWEPGRRTRRFKAFHVVEGRYPPDPELIQDYLATAATIEKGNLPPFARMALKYFRYGLIDDQPEDQFMRLWLALEIIAENVKEKSRVPIACPACNSALKCPTCGSEPTRVPMAKQAIDRLLAEITGEAAQDVSRRQFIARNGLMHGRATESIEADCKASLPQIVDELGALTWNAIMSTLTPAGDGALAFGHRSGEFVNKVMVVSMVGEFDHMDEGPHPSEDKIPAVKISMQTRFQQGQA